MLIPSRYQSISCCACSEELRLLRRKAGITTKDIKPEKSVSTYSAKASSAGTTRSAGAPPQAAPRGKGSPKGSPRGGPERGSPRDGRSGRLRYPVTVCSSLMLLNYRIEHETGRQANLSRLFLVQLSLCCIILLDLHL